MIKNILKSKLFVLCSMLFCSLAVSVFFFGTSSKAYNTNDEQRLADEIYTNFGITCYENTISDVISHWESNKDNYPYLFVKCEVFEGSNYGGVYLCPSAPTVSNGNYVFNNFSVIRTYTGTSDISITNFWTRDNNIYYWQDTFVNTSTPANNCLLFSYDQFHTPDIDFTDLYYSANIQSPNVNITYREFTSVPTIDVPLNVIFLNDLENYYFESFALFCQPETVAVTVENGQYAYYGFDYDNVWRPLVDLEDLKKPSDFSVDSFHLLLNDAWYHSRLTDSMIDFIYPTGFSSNSQTNASNKFHNLRKNQCMSLNQIYLYFRYFTIVDGQVIVGPWRIWTSYDPSVTTEEIPQYIQPYLPAVGTTGTTTDLNPVSTSSPEPTQIYNPSSTGSNVNVTVTQNVPNYPDYPTIASYNKDNLLVDTINQLGAMEGFFGEFGSFLVTAFAFMPAWIWAIIGVGFSLSIVVMFLKIL